MQLRHFRYVTNCFGTVFLSVLSVNAEKQREDVTEGVDSSSSSSRLSVAQILRSADSE